MLKRSRYKFEEQEQLIPLINEIRRDHPRMPPGISALRFNEAVWAEISLRGSYRHRFRIKQLRNFRVTTNSLGVTRFANLIKDLEVTRVNQVFVSDITYFDLLPITDYLLSTLYALRFDSSCAIRSISHSLHRSLPALLSVIASPTKEGVAISNSHPEIIYAVP